MTFWTRTAHCKHCPLTLCASLQKVHMEMVELTESIISPFTSQKINQCMHTLVLNNSLLFFQAELANLNRARVFSLLKRKTAKKGAYFFPDLSWSSTTRSQLISRSTEIFKFQNYSDSQSHIMVWHSLEQEQMTLKVFLGKDSTGQWLLVGAKRGECEPAIRGL